MKHVKDIRRIGSPYPLVSSFKVQPMLSKYSIILNDGVLLKCGLKNHPFYEMYNPFYEIPIITRDPDQPFVSKLSM